MRTWLEVIADWPILRWLAGSALLARGAFFRLVGRRYRAFEDCCRAERICHSRLLRWIAYRPVARLIEETRKTGKNRLVGWYLQSATSRRCAAGYLISGGGPSDLFRDLLVLKSATDDEKGVLLLKYARTFEAAVALLDIERLMQRYTIVLEPCWAGYCDPALLMYFAPDCPVFVQCFTDEDFDFLVRVGAPLVPVRLGPADWVNAEVFRGAISQPKIYDLVMVANWGAHKRHARLFEALREITDRDLRVLLVGFAWAGRGADDVRREAGAIGNPRVSVEMLENIPHDRLAAKLGQCKAFVFLTRKEGDNKALVEAMFADVPAIVYDRTIGGARSRINPATGVLSSDEELARTILHMLDHYREFTPRQWAIAHTGSAIATRVVDDALRRIAQERGEAYASGIVEKVNSPNLAYRHADQGARFTADYEFIASCLRQRPAA